MNFKVRLANEVFIPIVVLYLLTPAFLRVNETLNLAGEWQFALDQNDVGTSEKRFDGQLPDKISLTRNFAGTVLRK